MQKRPKRHGFIKTLAALALICAAIMCDSAYRLTVSQYTAESPRLPEAFDGFRIVQLSDLHGDQFGEDNARLVKRVAAQEPDIIALTGDFVDGPEDLKTLETLCTALTKIAPVYFVTGNHDCASGLMDEAEEILYRSGAVYLKNDYLALEKNGQRVIIAGVEDPNRWADMTRPDELVDIIRSEYPEDYIILLGHRNYWAQEYPQLPVDIILCGHAHGGIIRLPFLGGVIGTDRRLFPEYEAGEYQSGEYALIVSRGLGFSVLPRFLNNPEIVTVELHSTNYTNLS